MSASTIIGKSQARPAAGKSVLKLPQDTLLSRIGSRIIAKHSQSFRLFRKVPILVKTQLTAMMIALALPAAATALELAMPFDSLLTYDDVTESGSYALPDAPYDENYLSTRQVTGYVSRQVWTLENEKTDTSVLIAPLRDQLQAEGYAILLDCSTKNCGGFDFRFATEVLPAPDMFVDLSDFRFIAALKDSSTGFEAVSALVSKTDVAGLIQLIAVQPQDANSALPVAKPDTTIVVNAQGFDGILNPADLIKSLEVAGHVILSDLAFETGSSNLTDGAFASLEALADYLRQKPEARLALVGHTDNVGSLEGNQALSERRAQSVLKALVDTHGIAAEKLSAQGVGYLAPIASNETEIGRTANRRVEAVLLAP